MFSAVGRNPLKINLHVWFYFIVFLTLLYDTCETGHIESSVFLSLSTSGFFGVYQESKRDVIFS